MNLRTAAGYAVLAGSTVTSTGPTIVSGNLGLSPGTSVTGFPPGLMNGGVQNVANPAAVQAKADLIAAYDEAAALTPATPVAASTLGGLTLTPGVYSGGALDLTGTLTLDAQGDSDAVFVFQAASTLITASASRVELVNGASPCNVFWKVGSSATLGTTTSFKGTILALASITAEYRRDRGRPAAGAYRRGDARQQHGRPVPLLELAQPSSSPAASARSTPLLRPRTSPRPTRTRT